MVPQPTYEFRLTSGLTALVRVIGRGHGRTATEVGFIGGNPTPQDLKEIDQCIQREVLGGRARLEVAQIEQDDSKRHAIARAYVQSAMEKN